jgi:GT2 family glycosyltransferase
MVSIIVPTIDRHAELERFLASATAQRSDRYEILVIDQGVTSAETVAARHRHVRFFRSSTSGLSHCRNIGIRHAAGDLLVFADDDCVLAGDYLATLSTYAPLLSDPLTFGFGNALNLEDDLPVVTTFNPSRATVGPWRCDTLCSISLVFNRTTFDRIGGFDERFGVGAPFPAGEETDLLLRMMAAGGRGVHLDRLTIRHPSRARTPDLVRRYETYGFAHGALARKHARNPTFLARFAYGLIRSLGGLALGLVRRDALASLYRASLRGKLRGFHAFARPHSALAETTS